MIEISRIIVHCDQGQCTAETPKALETLRLKIAEAIGIPSNQVIFTHSEITDNEKN